VEEGATFSANHPFPEGNERRKGEWYYTHFAFGLISAAIYKGHSQTSHREATGLTAEP